MDGCLPQTLHEGAFLVRGAGSLLLQILDLLPLNHGLGNGFGGIEIPPSLKCENETFLVLLNAALVNCFFNTIYNLITT